MLCFEMHAYIDTYTCYVYNMTYFEDHLNCVQFSMPEVCTCTRKMFAAFRFRWFSVSMFICICVCRILNFSPSNALLMNLWPKIGNLKNWSYMYILLLSNVVVSNKWSPQSTSASVYKLRTNYRTNLHKSTQLVIRIISV